MKKTLFSKLRSSNYNSLAYSLSYYVYTQNAQTLQAVFHWVTWNQNIYTTFVDYIRVRCAKQFHE